jgi:hypothetical protein
LGSKCVTTRRDALVADDVGREVGGADLDEVNLEVVAVGPAAADGAVVVEAQDAALEPGLGDVVERATALAGEGLEVGDAGVQVPAGGLGERARELGEGRAVTAFVDAGVVHEQSGRR